MRKVISNTIYQLVGSISSKLIGFVFVIVASRSLGTEGYGKYSFAYTFVSFFAMMASFGVPTIATRELAKDPGKREIILGDIIILKSLLGLIAFVLCLVTAKLMGYPADVQLGFKIVALGLLLSFLQSYDSFFQATLQMQYIMLTSILRDAMLLASAFYLSHIGAGFVSYIWFGLGATILSGLLLSARGYSLVKPKFQYNSKRLGRFLWESFPLGMASFVVYLYYNADSIMLSKMSTMTVVGYYAVAYKFVYLGQMIPGALVNSLFPGFSHNVTHDRNKAEENLKTAYKLFSYLSIGLAVMGVLYNREIIQILFGDKYQAAALPLMIFSISFVFMLPNILLSKYLVAAGKQSYIFYVHLASVALNVALNFYAIPRYGAAGAAATTLISDITVFLVFYYKINKVLEVFKVNLKTQSYFIIVGLVNILIGQLLKLNVYLEVLGTTGILLCYVYWKEKEKIKNNVRHICKGC